ncbi:hypothetical protein F2Q68_00039024 [Brassica cretica]|uniref:Uncharacterized protein n=1 Tax=Brassica cretica TaxID=69181 RepID=A0A8S9MME5_BRACR|nr:hypothetical protein F2Q68_00039024 [Brassica cretica]
MSLLLHLQKLGEDLIRNFGSSGNVSIFPFVQSTKKRFEEFKLHVENAKTRSRMINWFRYIPILFSHLQEV